MKFASFFLIGLIHLTSAQDNNFGLRASALGATTTINTSVLVEGVNTQAVTAEDMDLIDQSVVTAFHQVYDDGETPHHGRNLRCNIGGWGCGGYDPNNPLHWNRWFFYTLGWDCRFCPLLDDDIYGNRRLTAAEDDDAPDSILALSSFHGTVPETQDDASHGLFEQAVCDNIRKSGSVVLEGAAGCAVSFYTLGFPTAAASCDHKQDVLLKIEGIAVDEDDDADMIEAAAKAAGLQHFEFQSAASAPGAEAASIIMGTVERDCGAAVETIDFAGTLCIHLHNLGFTKAHGCEIAVVSQHMMADKNAAKDEEQF